MSIRDYGCPIGYKKEDLNKLGGLFSSKESNIGARVVTLADSINNKNLNGLMLTTENKLQSLVTSNASLASRNAQLVQELSAYKTREAQNQQPAMVTTSTEVDFPTFEQNVQTDGVPTQESGMQTSLKGTWSHKDQLLLNQLTDGQDKIDWTAVQQQFPERNVHKLKSHYKNQQRKDQIVLQQQQINALQQQNNSADKIHERNVSNMANSFNFRLGNYIFKGDKDKLRVAEFAVKEGWVRKGTTYVNLNDPNNRRTVETLVKELSQAAII